MARIYALQVGINVYPAGSRQLHGCVNDVGRYREYLTRRFAPETLAIETLLDTDATYANVIEQFRKHLGRAGEGDVALFQYCGHGAQSTSAPEFLPFDPAVKEQGLVCTDSRTPGKFDLADKELAVLIAEVAARGPHITVILDACHSGSGTRSAEEIAGAVPRFEEEAPYKREIGQYIDEYYLKQGANIAIPAARHILLAACDQRQTAKERNAAGIFTSTLIEVLEKSGDDLSYADLFVRTRAAVRKRAADQDPQFETFGGFNAQSGFLGGASRVRRGQYRAVYDQGGWRVNCGAIHGLPTDPTRKVAFALYPEDGGDAVGAATAVVVGAQETTLAPDFDNVPGVLAYDAEMTSLPVAPMLVGFDGPGEVRAALEAALADEGRAGVALADPGAATDHVIIQAGDVLWVVETATGRRVQGVAIDTAKPEQTDVARLIWILAKIATWRRGLDLQNLATRIDRELIEMSYEKGRRDGEPDRYGPGIVPIEIVPDAVPLKDELKLRNKTRQRLHATLLYFSPEYWIEKLANVELPVADLTAAGEGWRTIYGLNQELSWKLDAGVDFSVDTFKVIISTEKIDDFLLSQSPLDIGHVWGRERGALSFGEKSAAAYKNDWFTLANTFHVRRRLDVVGTQDAVLAGGAVTVLGHSGVKASLAVSAAAAGTRDIGGSDLPRALAMLGMPLVDFGEGTRGGGANVLEITDIAHAEALATEPLQIALKVPLAAYETIVPLVFDGECMRLGGDSKRTGDGVVVSVDTVPQTADNARSLLGSLKLYFVKTALKQENVNSLRRVEVMPDGRVERQKFGVADAVAASSGVLLLVHGITGDTAEMAADVVASGIAAKFDLVLTYDYENLGTPIGDTALALEQALKGVGIAAGDGKSLTILAHSTGGLVSRCFIERGGGRDTVDHLVMCGTPNGGSPLGKAGAAMAVARLLGDFAANVAPASLPFLAPLRSVLKAAGGVTKSLEQINPASNFILELNASDDPGVRYTILAGSIDAYVAAGDGFAGRALVAAGRSAAFDLLFESQPNDIAVGVESIKTIGGVRAVKPVRHDVACHHLNYFASDAGRAALQAVAW